MCGPRCVPSPVVMREGPAVALDELNEAQLFDVNQTAGFSRYEFVTARDADKCATTATHLAVPLRRYRTLLAQAVPLIRRPPRSAVRRGCKFAK